MQARTPIHNARVCSVVKRTCKKISYKILHLLSLSTTKVLVVWNWRHYSSVRWRAESKARINSSSWVMDSVAVLNFNNKMSMDERKGRIAKAASSCKSVWRTRKTPNNKTSLFFLKLNVKSSRSDYKMHTNMLLHLTYVPLLSNSPLSWGSKLWLVVSQLGE